MAARRRAVVSDLDRLGRDHRCGLAELVLVVGATGVDDADVEVVGEDQDVGSGVSSTDADVA
jgi:hypothetical protein